VFGSDWPVSTVKPLDNIEVAVTRRMLGDAEGKSYLDNPRQCISVEEAIQAYTINAAYALRLENEIGSIEVGKKADLVILRKNILSCPSHEIHEATPEVVVVNGNTYRFD